MVASLGVKASTLLGLLKEIMMSRIIGNETGEGEGCFEIIE
jgi:hypothetical protein